ERGWYSDRQMKGIGGDWLFKTVRGEMKIPPWLPDDLVDEFIDAREVDRCAMCYIEQYRHLIGRRDCVVVDFDQLIRRPQAYFTRLVEALGERFGPLTDSLLQSVREPPKDRAIETSDIPPQRRKQLPEIYQSCRELSLAV